MQTKTAISFIFAIFGAISVFAQNAIEFDQIDKAEKEKLVRQMVFTELANESNDCIFASGYFRYLGRNFVVRSCAGAEPTIKVVGDLGYVSKMILIDTVSGSGWIIAARDLFRLDKYRVTNDLAFDGAGEAVLDLRFVDGMTGWAVGTRGLIMATKDGITWERQGANTNFDLVKVAFADAKNGWILGNTFRQSGQDLISLRTRDGGKTWENDPQSPEKMPIHMLFLRGGVGWMASRNKTISMTKDAGVTWKQISRAPTSITEWDFPDQKTGWIGGDDGLYKTVDGGKTWRRIRSAKLDSTGYFEKVKAVGRSNVWVITSNEEFLFSRNGGRNWISIKDRLVR